MCEIAALPVIFTTGGGVGRMSGRWAIIFCKQNATQNSEKVVTTQPVNQGEALTAWIH